MAMDRKAFDAMVERLEHYARQNPGAYKARVLGFALLGYGYLATMLLLLLALLALTALSVIWLKAAGLKLLLILGPFVALVARAMWVEVKAPTGLLVTKRHAPALFERIERLRRALRAPRFHRVVITDELNAAVVQVPRLGLFGWHRNYLVLGMPLLKCLTPEQLDAVLAHEFGHLAGGHARFSNWLYRMRRAWSQLQQELDHAQSSGAFLFRAFFDWYAPRFAAYSFPLARANEYEADAAAARVTSKRAAAEALSGVEVAAAYLDERYWPDIHAKASDAPAPAFAPFASLGQGLAGTLDGGDGQRWLERSLTRATSTDDTHPSLRDRLAAIGESARIAPPAEGTSADLLLGSSRDAYVAKLDERWQERVIHDWRKRYDEVQEGRARLAELAAAAETAEPSIDDAFERAWREEAYGAGRTAAIERLRALIQRAPDHAGAQYGLGSRLLANDDAEGVAPLERALALDPEGAYIAVHVALRDYHWRRGDKDKANEHHDLAAAREQTDNLANAERSVVNLHDTFDPHGLAEAQVAALRDALRATPGVRRAWLAQKRCKHHPQHRLYVLGFTCRHPLGRHNEQRAIGTTRRIHETVALPGHTMILCTDGQYYRFRRKLRRIRGARIL